MEGAHVTDLVAGANQPLPDGVLGVSLPGPFDLSVIVVGADGKVSGDGDFVFYNQPSAPGVHLRLGTATVDPRRLRAGAERVVLVASPETDGVTFRHLPVPTVTVTAGDGRPLARFVPRGLGPERAVQLIEIYRRAAGWKVRAVGAGYADGLAGLARDFGVNVADDGHATPPPPARAQVAPPPLQQNGNRAARSTRDADAGVFAEVIRLTNAERARAGRGALTFDARLAAAAQAHSEHMVAAGFFAHDSPDGRSVSDRVTAAGYRYARVAENIAAGQTSPAEVVAGWMDSPGHRKNILDPDVTQIGVGRANGGSYGVYWTQVFGRARDW
jgi:uncharacterized protein YkwD/stress response protein SCP2